MGDFDTSARYLKATIIIEELTDDGKIYEFVFHKLAPSESDQIVMDIETEYEEDISLRRNTDRYVAPVAQFLHFKFDRVPMMEHDNAGEGDELYRVTVTDKPIKKHYYFSTCMDCEPILPQPFTSQFERESWTRKHVEGTGHKIHYSESDG